MEIAEVIVTTTGWLMFPEKETSIRKIMDRVSLYFNAIPQDVRYERVVVRGPVGKEQHGYLFVGLRETTRFLTATECKLPAYRSLAQIIDSATTKSLDLSTMGLMVPDYAPNELTIYVRG